MFTKNKLNKCQYLSSIAILCDIFLVGMEGHKRLVCEVAWLRS